MVLGREIAERVFEPLHHLHASVIAQGFELFENHGLDITLFYEMFKALGGERHVPVRLGGSEPARDSVTAVNLTGHVASIAGKPAPTGLAAHFTLQRACSRCGLLARLHHVEQCPVTQQDLAAGLGDLFAALVFAFTA